MGLLGLLREGQNDAIVHDDGDAKSYDQDTLSNKRLPRHGTLTLTSMSVPGVTSLTRHVSTERTVGHQQPYTDKVQPWTIIRPHELHCPRNVDHEVLHGRQKPLPPSPSPPLRLSPQLFQEVGAWAWLGRRTAAPCYRACDGTSVYSPVCRGRG